ncbi:unnamed protein product [Phaeothamnion confervicola]
MRLAAPSEAKSEPVGEEQKESHSAAEGDDGGEAGVIQTFDKVYDALYIQGFKIRAEPGVFETHKGLRALLEADVALICRLLPPPAAERIRTWTCIWFNAELRFGPADRPADGRGSCFHPSRRWLLENGMSGEKARGIEFYRAADYVAWHDEQPLMLLHEMAHVLHWHAPCGGFDHPAVLAAYDAALERGTYELVEMRGCPHCCCGDEEDGNDEDGGDEGGSGENGSMDGKDSSVTGAAAAAAVNAAAIAAVVPARGNANGLRGRSGDNSSSGGNSTADDDATANDAATAASDAERGSTGTTQEGGRWGKKSGCGNDDRMHARQLRPAYALVDPMEYFAELSVAFFSPSVGPRTGNKFFPFTRCQLRAHDPAGFATCRRLWGLAGVGDDQEYDAEEEEKGGGADSGAAAATAAPAAALAAGWTLEGEEADKSGGGDGAARASLRGAKF